METVNRSSLTSSAASFIDDSEQSTVDNSPTPSRPSDASHAPAVRSSTPSSWYAQLASEPPRAEDFIIYDAPNESVLTESVSVSQFSDNPVVISETLPDEQQLARAADVHIYRSETDTVPFSSLYSGSDSGYGRHLIVFIRHFYCGACRDYVKALARSLPASDSPEMRRTTVSILSCCSPKLIEKYEAVVGTGFRMYADPKRKLFHALGCKRYALTFGKRRPRYVHTNQVLTFLGTFRDIAKAKGKDGLIGGSMLQVGGEFLFEHGKPVWCHRMTNIRDHTEVDVISQVLKVDGRLSSAGYNSYDASFIEDDGADMGGDIGEATTCDSGVCSTPLDLSGITEALPYLEDEVDDDSLQKPPTVRRVTEELSDDEHVQRLRASLGDRPSCVPGHRPDDL